jgi:hypothetical protein
MAAARLNHSRARHGLLDAACRFGTEGILAEPVSSGIVINGTEGDESG